MTITADTYYADTAARDLPYEPDDNDGPLYFGTACAVCGSPDECDCQQPHPDDRRGNDFLARCRVARAESYRRQRERSERFTHLAKLLCKPEPAKPGPPVLVKTIPAPTYPTRTTRQVWGNDLPGERTRWTAQAAKIDRVLENLQTLQALKEKQDKDAIATIWASPLMASYKALSPDERSDLKADHWEIGLIPLGPDYNTPDAEYVDLTPTNQAPPRGWWGRRPASAEVLDAEELPPDTTEDDDRWHRRLIAESREKRVVRIIWPRKESRRVVVKGWWFKTTGRDSKTEWYKSPTEAAEAVGKVITFLERRRLSYKLWTP